jgi:hypothetical protein
VTLYNRYILFLALILSITSIIFATTSTSELGLCFSIYLLECLILTELFIHLNPKAKRGLSRVNYVLFALFAVLVAAKVAEIVLGASFL